MITQIGFGNLIPELRRPEYAPSPETFLTSIAWSMFDLPSVSSTERVLFRQKERESSKVGKTHRFMYAELLNRSAEFKVALKDAGIQLGGPAERVDADLVQGILNGLSGTSSLSSSFISAVPIVPSSALLQTVRGMKGKDTDTNFAGMLETIFLFGAMDAGSSPRLAELWLRSLESRLIDYPLLGAIDQAIDSLVGPRVKKPLRESPIQSWKLLDALPELKRNSPFAWLHSSWINLNSTDWVDALPPRVWTDWAATLLRTSFGMTYLWEAAWVNRVATLILDDSSAAADIAGVSIGGLLHWSPSSATQELRDAGRYIGRPLRRSGELRKIIEDYVQTSGGDSLDVVSGLERAKRDRNLKSRLAQVRLKPKAGKAYKDTVEAVSYSLQTRGGSGANADFYGVLNSFGRRGAWEVSPGTEWLACVASLIAAKPGLSLNLGQVMNQLSNIGISVNTPQVISLLERAGLARGSDDADLGLSVQTAFNQRGR
jgi:hypothetical protein